MKILQVIPYFAPKRGGEVTVCYNLSKQLVKKGHDVVILTTDFEFDRKFADSIEKEGVKVIPLHCVVNIGLFIYSPSMKKWLKDNMKNFDIIHMHTFRAYQNPLIYHYARKYRIPYFVQAHGSILPIYQKILFKKLFDIAIGNKILMDSSKVIAITQTESDQYKKMGVNPSKIEIIPNGIDISRFEYTIDKGVFKKRLGIDNNTKIVLFVGRLHKVKGIDFLIKSFNLLQKDIDNLVLVIAGPDDGYKQELLKLVKEYNLEDKVKFIDYLEDVTLAYSDADVLVCPSAYEIFGLVPLEAILCNTPIIITENCGCVDVLKSQNFNYIAKYGDIDDLRDKIKYILTNSQDAKTIINECKKYILTNMTWDKISYKMECAYADCVHNI